MENTLYYGDNLNVLQEHIKDDTVDLIYLDPPFKSGRNYSLIFKEANGSDSVAQRKAFEDTWTWDETASRTYNKIMKGQFPQELKDTLRGFDSFLEKREMFSYLVMMGIRLVELKRVLKSTGSIYLHCDPSASHYLKILMDSIFNPLNFQNEIIWYYQTGGASKKRFSRKHDTIFFYTKSDKWAFNSKDVAIKRTEKALQRAKCPKGARISVDDIYKNPDDVFIIPQMNPMAKERLGYPTQKPEALLEGIIKASSNTGDIVLDPFCGCGTTVVVAEKLKRKWIGIDITYLATNLIKTRLKDTFIDRKEPVSYKVIGEPEDLKSAKALAKSDPYQFQYWALGLVEARPSKEEEKRGADKGIDGKWYFQERDKSYKQILISVKSGHVGRKDIGELRGVIDRENAPIGVFITLHPPTREMRTEAASTGFYTSPWDDKSYSRIQILTIEELLAGAEMKYPRGTTEGGRKKARKHTDGEQITI